MDCSHLSSTRSMHSAPALAAGGSAGPRARILISSTLRRRPRQLNEASKHAHEPHRQVISWVSKILTCIRRSHRRTGVGWIKRAADAPLEAYLLPRPSCSDHFETTAAAAIWIPFLSIYDRWFRSGIRTASPFVSISMSYLRRWLRLVQRRGYGCDLPRSIYRIVGLDRLAWFHLNDSAKALGSRVDRHAGNCYIKHWAGVFPLAGQRLDLLNPRWRLRDSGTIEFKENLDCSKSLSCLRRYKCPML